MRDGSGFNSFLKSKLLLVASRYCIDSCFKKLQRVYVVSAENFHSLLIVDSDQGSFIFLYVFVAGSVKANDYLRSS